MALPYDVPGLVPVLAQRDSMACWATVYTMMVSWKDQASYDIREAVAKAGPHFLNYYDTNFGLPAEEFGPFLSAVGMTHEPMIDLTIEGWENLLRSKGLLWVGTLAALDPTSGLHSRIVEGMEGDGSPDGTSMKIIDPAGGHQYEEQFRIFVKKYEDAFKQTASDDYFQIRHF